MNNSFVGPITDKDVLEKMPQTLCQYEQNKKLYADILEALNNQSKMISQGMSDEFR
jgi:hypothetical protein